MFNDGLIAMRPGQLSYIFSGEGSLRDAKVSVSFYRTSLGRKPRVGSIPIAETRRISEPPSSGLLHQRSFRVEAAITLSTFA